MGAESRKRAQNLGGALMPPRRTAGAIDPHGRSRHQGRRACDRRRQVDRQDPCATRCPTRSDSALKATETINARSAQAVRPDARRPWPLLRTPASRPRPPLAPPPMPPGSTRTKPKSASTSLSDTLFRTAPRATNAAEDGLERARQRIEKASQPDRPDEGRSASTPPPSMT